MVSPREQAELPYKGRSGEDEAAEEEASGSSSQRERKQGKSSREQSDCKGRRCLPTQLSERRMKGKSPGTTPNLECIFYSEEIIPRNIGRS